MKKLGWLVLYAMAGTAALVSIAIPVLFIAMAVYMFLTA